MTKQGKPQHISDMFARESEPTISTTELNQENTIDKKLRGRTIDFTQTLRNLSLGESLRSALTSSMHTSTYVRV